MCINKHSLVIKINFNMILPADFPCVTFNLWLTILNVLNFKCVILIDFVNFVEYVSF